ncbi:MAG: SDR family NAD(P)-dependent oxidoreductase [Hyphomicrobiaceae bacterium]
MKSLGLKNKTILLTGAGGYLGQAVACQLASAGANVLLNGRASGSLEKIRTKIQNSGGSATSIVGDISDGNSQTSICQEIQTKFGKLDGLVNNAYSGTVGGIKHVNQDDMRNSLELNVVAPFFLTRRLIPLLTKSGAGSVVNIASIYGMVSPDPSIYSEARGENPSFYGAGKAGLIQLTRYLSCHLTRNNIRVNCVSPGPFPSDIVQRNDPEFIKKLAHKVPMGRIGRAEEVGGAVQFLLSDAASYVTGVNIPVDGGWTAGSN